MISMDKKINYSGTLTDNLLPAVIIREHIQKILRAESIGMYIADIEKLEDLLSTEIDETYEKEEIEIEEKVKNFKINFPIKLNKSAYDDFSKHKEAKREQYKKKLIFRSLVKLAKRKGIWLVDEETAIISHDKKKATSMERK